MWMLAAKATYIGQLEIAAVVCAYLTFPDVLEGRVVHHCVDNESAKMALVSGYSGKLDSAALVCLYHEVVLGLGCNVWLSFVYSEDNWADEPSRGVYRSLLVAGARRRALVLPSKRRLWSILSDFGVV